MNMAGETNGAIALDSTKHIPIAQLSPELAAPATRSIKAVVTLTWPYSSATGSVAFLLSEPDFRLRRTRGQVRVRFSGSSAKAIASSGIASGDEVIMCLDGVEWVSGDTTVVTPGRGVDFELRFSERLLLQFKQEDSEEVKNIDLDRPPPAETVEAPARIPTPEPAQPFLPTHPPAAKRTLIGTQLGDEWSSPAFIERARTSYGSLFESEYDIFAEEDGSIPGKGRKRARISSTWRYASRSPTPEAEEPEVESMDTSPETAPALKPAPTMTDEGCQTVDIDKKDSTEYVAQELTDLSRQATNVGGAAYPISNGFASFGQPPSLGTCHTSHANTADLPTIRTEEFNQQIDTPEVEPEIPKSPRLQPVPSDSLSQVSPLLSTKQNIFSQPNGEVQVETAQPVFGYESTNTANGLHSAQHVEHQQLFGNQPDDMHANGDTLAIHDEEDIYTASPPGRREQQAESLFSGFQEPEVTNADMEFPIFCGQVASEDQYGHWQGAGAQLSNAASPTNEVFMEGTHGDHLYVGEEDHHEDEEPYGASVRIPLTEYPELEDGLLGHAPPAWGASSVAYPELPNPGDNSLPYTHQAPRSSAMSRSYSAQSAVVDLTESGDDADSDAPLQSGDEYDESVEGDSEDVGSHEPGEVVVGQPDDESDEGESEEGEFNGVQVSARRHGQNEDEDEDADATEDEEGEYEEEEFYAKMPSTFGPDQDRDDQMEENDQDEEGSYEEEDEGSYDEEESEDEGMPEPRFRPQPEVIDLLSSDDEAETQSRSPSPTTNSRRSIQNRSISHMPGDDSGDGDREIEDEEPLSYAEQSGNNTSSSAQNAGYSSSEDSEGDEEDAVYEDELAPDMAALNDESGSDEEGSEDLDPELNPQADESDVEFEEQITEVPQGNSASARVIETLNLEIVAQGDDEVNDVHPSEQLQPHQESESGGMEVGSPARSIARVHSPPRASLLSRIFSIDGADDEPRFGASYHSMSREEATLPSSFRLPNVFAQTSLEQISKEDTIQPPTPEDTQISRKTVSLENSFTSVTGIQQQTAISPDEMDVDEVDESPAAQPNDIGGETTLAVAGSSPVADVQTFSENVTVTVEVSEQIGMMETGNYVETHAEKIIRIVEATETSDISRLEETDEPEGRTEHEEDLEPEGELESEEELETEEDVEPVETIVPLQEYEELKGSKRDEETKKSTQCPAKLVIEIQQPVTSHEQLRSYDGVDDSRPQSRDRDTVTDEPELQIECPRRSTRKTNPNFRAAAKENARPVTPVKTVRTSKENTSALKSNKTSTSTKGNKLVTPVGSRGLAPSTSSDNEQSPLVVIESQATPRGHDASSEFALETADISSPPQHNLRKPPVADLKLRLTRALRTEFSEFTGLKVLRFHLTQKLDFLAVATSTPPEPQRAKNGPRQYQITFNITDPSIAPSSVTEVQVFRPYKDALPIVRAGDGILLRNFLVMSVQRRGGGPVFALRSTQEDASSWAVFKDGNEVEIRGPPVEFGDAEKSHVMQLKAWYAGLDKVAMAKIARANGDRGTVGSAAGHA